MNCLNSVLIEGTCMSKPMTEVRPGKDTAVCSFTIQSLRKDAEGLDASLFEIEARGNLAGRIEQTINRGRGLRIVGRMKQIRWLDDSGQERSKVRIIAEHVEFRPIGGPHEV